MRPSRAAIYAVGYVSASWNLNICLRKYERTIQVIGTYKEKAADRGNYYPLFAAFIVVITMEFEKNIDKWH